MIIAKLQTQTKNLKSKLRLKSVGLQQQEKVLSELEKENHAMKKGEEVRKTELQDGREREERLQGEVEVGNPSRKWSYENTDIELTIPAGTTVYAEDDARLVVARGAKLNAVGWEKIPWSPRVVK